MKLTKDEMIASIDAHTSNKIPNWPPELVAQIKQVIIDYQFDSYETTISPSLARTNEPRQRPSRSLREGVFQRGF